MGIASRFDIVVDVISLLGVGLTGWIAWGHPPRLMIMVMLPLVLAVLVMRLLRLRESLRRRGYP